MTKTIKWMTSALVVGTFGTAAMGAGSLNPTSAPTATMHSLDEIYQKVAYIGTDVVSVIVVTNIIFNVNAGLPKTGQTNSWNDVGSLVVSNRDDGDFERGAAWPVPRFTDNGNGTVLDNLTGLTWLKDANAFGARNWTNALADCATLNNGEHGLSDGSVEGNWRLPNVREQLSLIDYGHYLPALPSGHPFTNYTFSQGTWSSTSSDGDRSLAIKVNTDGGFIEAQPKGNSFLVWPVRGGP